jgi:hypothetical protein
MSAPIRFDVSNPQTPDAGAVIYISADADTWGRLTLTLTNTRSDNSDVKFDTTDVLQVYIEVLTPADIKNITVADASGWAGGPDATSGHLELHPNSPVTIPSQSSISLELHHVLGQAPRQGKMRFYCTSLGIRNAVVQAFVQRPPADAAKQWGLVPTLVTRVDYQSRGDTVYVTASGKPDIVNYLLVQLYRQTGGTLPSAGMPQLSFSFLTGDGDLALCSEDRLKKVTASIADQRPAGRWKNPAPNSQGEDTVWTVSPADGGGDLFPEDGLLTLRFDNIVTDLPAGGTAVMFIQYSGLTGYDDGYIPVVLSKTTPVPYLRSFVAYQGDTKVPTGGTVLYGALKLGWEVFAAEAAVLRDVTAGPSSDQVKGPTDTGTMRAVTAQVSYQIIPRVAGVDHPEDGGELNLSVAPPTASLSVTPESHSYHAMASWNCTSGDHCTLLQDNVLVADTLPLAGHHDVSLPREGSSTLLIQCHGISTATATVVAEGWLEDCRQNIAKLGPSASMCDPSFCNAASEYLAHVCNCQPPYQGDCGDNPQPNCCPYIPSSAIAAYDRGGLCYCCCGNTIHVAAVAMAQGIKPAQEVQLGERVRVALDGGLTRWSERPVAFSAGIGADPANPMIEIRFGDAADPRTILAARNQLFLTPGGVLKRAARLVAGKDVLMRADGSSVPVLLMTATQALRGVHHVATSREPATELAGHLIVVNGVVCADYALQVNDLDAVRPELLAAGHADLPEFGSDDYARQFEPA